jgi:hypothetical protein
MLIFQDGDCYNGGEPETEDLDVWKATIKGYIDKFAADKRIKLAGPPSPEYASWPLKLAEANNGGGPLLQMEADARGVPLAALVERVIGNAAAYEQAEALIAGTAGRHKDAVSALTTIEELRDYDWRF